MTENNQNRILRVATLLADASYPILSGLDDHEIKDIEAKLQKEIPEVCKDILRVLNWAGEDVAVDSVVMQESSPIGEIVFNGFFSASQWSDLTKSSQNDLEWCRELDADDKVFIEGAVKPNVYNENRIFFSYGNGLYWFIDLDPGEGGVVGQVVMLYPMYKEHHIKVMAPDMLSFVELVVTRLG